MPPLYRTKLGIGLFLVTLFTGTYGSAAEEFLLVNCYAQELLKLEEGIEIVINNQKYFLQARLIQHIWDSKALDKMLKCQSSGTSYSGCVFCKGITGKYIGINGKMTYPGHRRILPLQHYLRNFGQSTKCCPKFYYEELPSLFAVEEKILYMPEIPVSKDNWKVVFWRLGILTKIEKNKDGSISYTIDIQNNEDNQDIKKKVIKN